MKKRILLIVPIMLLLFFSFSVFGEKEIKVLEAHGNYNYQPTFDSLEEHAEIIVIIQPKKDIMEREQKIAYFKDDNGNNRKEHIEDRWTSTEVKIDKVLKSNDKTLKEGNTIHVNEQFFIEDENTMVIKNEYIPMEKNEKYLAMIKKHPVTGDFYITNFNEGKYKLKEMNSKVKTKQSKEVKTEKHKIFKEKAIKKFEKEIQEELKETE